MREVTSARSATIRRSAPDPELGSQLEDLRVHVVECERRARFDDRRDLAERVAAGRKRRRPPGA